MKDLFDLSVEVYAASCIITGLSNNLDNKEGDKLTADAMSSAMFGVASYLERIADDMDELSVKKD